MITRNIPERNPRKQMKPTHTVYILSTFYVYFPLSMFTYTILYLLSILPPPYLKPVSHPGKMPCNVIPAHSEQLGIWYSHGVVPVHPKPWAVGLGDYIFRCMTWTYYLSGDVSLKLLSLKLCNTCRVLLILQVLLVMYMQPFE